MFLPFVPHDHYWVVAGSATQVYHSGRRAYVPVGDSSYQTWLAMGHQPTRIASDAELRLELANRAPEGLPDGDTTLRDRARAQARALLAKQDLFAQGLRVGLLLSLDNDNRVIDAMTDLKARVAAAANTVAGIKAAFAGWSLPSKYTDAQLKQAMDTALSTGRGD